MRCQQAIPCRFEVPTSDWNQIGQYQIQTVAIPASVREESKLSPREWQALLLFAEGKSAAKVAKHMNISINTADTYKRRIFVKLGVNSIAEAASLATAFTTGARVRKLEPDSDYWMDADWSASND